VKTISLDRDLRRGSPCGSGLPAEIGLNHASPLLGLAPGGVYHAGGLTPSAVRSYRTFSPLPTHGVAEANALDGGSRAGGLFSVALSLSGDAPKGPAQRWALPITAVQWCSDFPPPSLDGQGAVFHASSVSALYDVSPSEERRERD